MPTPGTKREVSPHLNDQELNREPVVSQFKKKKGSRYSGVKIIPAFHIFIQETTYCSKT